MEEYSSTYHNEYLRNRAYFQSYEDRLKTFDTWSQNTTSLDKSHMAASGFYYSQSLDKVYCFHCGGLLHSWGYLDNPYFEHAFWYPKCSFIRSMLGEITMRRVETEIKSSPDVDIARKNMYRNIVNLGNGQQLTNPYKPLCVICKKNCVNTCILPCRHIKLCSTCSARIENCPICNLEVSMFIKVNF